MTTPEHAPLRHNRDWTLLLTGTTVSAIGSGMTGLAFLMLARAITGSSAHAGVASAMVMVGTVVATLPAGALVDRWNRKHVMVWTSLAGAAAFLTIPVAALLGHLTYPHLLAVAFVEGTLGCFHGPAESGALKSIVPPDQMGAATSANRARSSLGSLLGPSLSGTLYGISRTLPMLGDALSFLWSAACIALVRTPLPAPERMQHKHIAGDVVDGMRWVWHTPAIRDITAAGLFLNMGTNGIITVAYLALQSAGESAQRIGLMETASGVAGLVGALLAPAVLARVRVGPLVLSSFALCTVLTVAMLASPSIWWTGGLLCALVLVVMPLNTGMGAYVVHITPDAMMGRAMSAASFVNLAAIPLATATGGVLIEHLGRVPAMAVFAVPLVLATLGSTASRAIRQIPRTAAFASVPQAD